MKMQIQNLSFWVPLECMKKWLLEDAFFTAQFLNVVQREREGIRDGDKFLLPCSSFIYLLLKAGQQYQREKIMRVGKSKTFPSLFAPSPSTSVLSSLFKQYRETSPNADLQHRITNVGERKVYCIIILNQYRTEPVYCTVPLPGKF